MQLSLIDSGDQFSPQNAFSELNRRQKWGSWVRIEGGRTLVEGKDFSPVSDPRMGSVPYKGSYEVWHEPPSIKTSLPDGTRLRVSFYHMVTVNQDQVMICPSEPKTVEVLRDEARRVHQLWGAKTYFMMHDEIRVLGWDESCVKRNLTPGAILADNVKTCARILRETAPGCRILVWSDMFDPNHNAHKDYYLVNGDLAGSWQGLDKGIVIAVWYFDKREASMRFFSGLGNKMLIAGYYDADPARIGDWLATARAVGGVEGVMYTTWRKDFSNLDAFSREIDRAVQ